MAVGEWQRRRVPLDEGSVEAAVGRLGPGDLEQARRRVDPRDAGTACGGDQRRAASAAADVDEHLARRGRDGVDEHLGGRKQPLGRALVFPQPPVHRSLILAREELLAIAWASRCPDCRWPSPTATRRR
jgi:hypothetical protein